MTIAVACGLIILLLLVIMLLAGVPIAVALAVSSIGAILPVLDMGASVLTGAQRIFSGISVFSLLAIPFFILAGNLMNKGGIAIRLINFAKIFTGSIPGALAHTNAVANMPVSYTHLAGWHLALDWGGRLWSGLSWCIRHGTQIAFACARIVWNCGWIFFAALCAAAGIGTLFGLGMLAVLLAQGYPLAGIDVYKRQVINNLHILFAVAIGGSWAKERAGGAFAAVISFILINQITGSVFGVTADMLNDPAAVTHTLFGQEILVNGYFTSVLGAPALNMGVFVGRCV